jgi:hypothetical protein
VIGLLRVERPEIVCWDVGEKLYVFSERSVRVVTDW